MLGTVLAIETLWDEIGLKKTFCDIARAHNLFDRIFSIADTYTLSFFSQPSYAWGI